MLDVLLTCRDGFSSCEFLQLRDTVSFILAGKLGHQLLTGNWIPREGQQRKGELNCGFNGAFFCAPPGLFETNCSYFVEKQIVERHLCWAAREENGPYSLCPTSFVGLWSVLMADASLKWTRSPARLLGL